MGALLDWIIHKGKGDRAIEPPPSWFTETRPAPVGSTSRTSSVLQEQKEYAVPSSSAVSPCSSPLLVSLGSSSTKKISDSPCSADTPIVKDVKATDYPTPEKYLKDPSKIPTFYSFQSSMVMDEDLQPGMIQALDVDRRLTLPTRTHIKFLVTATDVIHSFCLPSLGLKVDAIPGRLVKVNTFIQREGVFYGQCSELCGTLHGFMPIVVEAVSPEAYAAHAKKFYKD